MTDPMLVWGLGLISVGLLLIVVEVFVPSAGIIAVTAAVVSAAGVVCLFRYDTTWGVIGAAACVVLGPSVLLFGLKIWPDTPIGRAMMHGTTSPEELRRRERAAAEEESRRASLIGTLGTAETDLHPSGLVRLDGPGQGPEGGAGTGQVRDALADGEWIGAGQRVRVVGVALNEVKVRRVV